MNQSTKKRCPKDTRRNKKTGLCEPVKKTQKKTILKKIKDVNTLSKLVVLEIHDQYNAIQSMDKDLILSMIPEITEKAQNDTDENYLIFQNILDMIFIRFPNENNYSEKAKQYNQIKNIITKPSVRDPDFQKKINRKLEFSLYKNTDPLEKALQEYSDKPLSFILNKEMEKQCSHFELTSTQKFLKRFLNPRNPYRSILLFHGTGVGKSCSAVSIAEGYLPELMKIGKKVYVLLNPSVKESFRKNIFFKVKLESDDVEEQCTRNTYLKNVKLTDKNKTKVAKSIDNQINQRYDFMGYLQFANTLEKHTDRIAKRMDLTDDEKKLRIIKYIKQIYSDSVIIIDEVHNIKETTDSNDTKKITKSLELVLTHADNVKLILLTATPMFDTPQEIVYILNLLLLNERRGKIDEKLFFNKDVLLDSKLDLFRYKIQGLVSYVRGENPIFFPAKVYPSNIIPNSKMPNKKIIDNTEVPIADEDKITNLKLVPVSMGIKQQEVYDKIIAEDKDSFRLSSLSCSNVIFPSEDDNIISKYGNLGFESCFEPVDDKGELMRKKGIKYRPRENFDFNEFVDSIDKYSGKISSILKNIKESKGIIFIYSRFLWTGVIPIAFCLEKLGFNRFGTGGNLLSGITQTNKMKSSTLTDPRYIIITGDPAFNSESIYKRYLELERDNKDGSQVKVILGTESAAEGLDFKMLREVHILEPFFHLSKNDQVVGRAIRRCSHTLLDFKDRNVMVYQYVSVKQGEENKAHYTETVDLELYRNAEQKDKRVAKVTYILKKNSVDCEINRPINALLNKKWSEQIEIVDSKGNNRRMTLGDYNKDDERQCNYRECDYKCNIESDNTIDKSTFKYPDDILDLIFDIQQTIIKILEKNNVIELSAIMDNILIRRLNIARIIEKEAIFYALDNIIRNKKEVKNVNKEICNVMRFNDIYILIPISMIQMRPTITEIIEGVLIEYAGNINASNLLEKIKDDTIQKDEETKQEQERIDIEQSIENIDETLPNLYSAPMFVIDSLCENVMKNKDNNRTLYDNLKFMNIIIDEIDNPGFFSINQNDELVFKYLDNVSQSFKIAKGDNEIYSDAIVQHKIRMRNVNLPNLLAYFEYDSKKKKSLFKIKDNRNTQENDKKIRIKRGAVCMTSGIDVIIDYYNILTEKKETREGILQDVKRGKKELLCSNLLNEFYKAEKRTKNKKVLLSIIDTKILL
jgi:hypothetical protein